MGRDLDILTVSICLSCHSFRHIIQHPIVFLRLVLAQKNPGTLGIMEYLGLTVFHVLVLEPM